jgi:hypothetical protein
MVYLTGSGRGRTSLYTTNAQDYSTVLTVGSVSQVSEKLKKLTLTAAAKKTAQIRLVLAGKPLKAINAALAAHRGVTAAVQVTATGPGGSTKASRSAQLTVK